MASKHFSFASCHSKWLTGSLLIVLLLCCYVRVFEKCNYAHALFSQTKISTSVHKDECSPESEGRHERATGSCSRLQERDLLIFLSRNLFTTFPSPRPLLQTNSVSYTQFSSALSFYPLSIYYPIPHNSHHHVQYTTNHPQNPSAWLLSRSMDLPHLVSRQLRPSPSTRMQQCLCLLTALVFP